MGRLASVVITIVIAALAFPAARHAAAQPAGGSGSDEIEMEPDQPPPTGSNTGSGSAAGSASTTEPAPVVKDPKVARKWLFAAQQLVQKGDYFTNRKRDDDAKAQYANAVLAYTKAIEAGDDVNVYYELAAVELKLGSIIDAAKHLKQVVAATGAKPAVVKQAKTKLDDVNTKIGYLTLTITPEGSKITLDGKELGTAPLKEPLVLMPGTYQLALEAAGFDPKQVELKIEAGSEAERKLDLDAKKVEVQQLDHTDEPAPPPPPPPAEPARWPLYAGAAFTAGFVGTSVVTGVIALSKHNTFTAGDTSNADRDSARSSGKTAAHITDLCIGGAVLAAGFTAYYYFFQLRSEHDDKPRAATKTASKLHVLPWVQPEPSNPGAGATVLGRF